uniref:Putative secreted protein n=1 Tax=Ixodes ricinus TaxID=34613 RepID=A0A6B0TZA9_IXORI
MHKCFSLFRALQFSVGMYPGGGCVLPAFQDGTRLDLGIVRYAEGGLCSYIVPDCSLARAQLVVLTENVQTTALIPDATPRARSQRQ